jgi:hypothetical protein
MMRDLTLTQLTHAFPISGIRGLTRFQDQMCMKAIAGASLKNTTVLRGSYNSLKRKIQGPLQASNTRACKSLK